VHPFGDLSAFLDDALSAERRAAVDAHLDTCSACRTRLAQLRATSRLIAALPSPVPSRRLVPRLSIPAWVAPLRTLSALGSGAAALLFVVSALTSALGGFATSGAAPAAAPAPNAAQPAGGAGAASSGTPSNFVVAPQASPLPVASQSAERSTASDAAKDAARQETGSPLALDERTRSTAGTPEPIVRAPSPIVWLALAFGLGLVWFILGRRLRAT
jgi:anti-sigma factor RsiW